MIENTNDFISYYLHGEEINEDKLRLIDGDTFVDVDYEEYKEKYEVNKKGEIRNKKTGRILKPYIVGGNANNPYMNVKLYNNNQQNIRQHKVAADAWLKYKGINDNQVNHLDNNPANNSVENLQWCDREFNMADRTYKNHATILQFSADDTYLLAVYPTLEDVEREGYNKKLVKECCLDHIEEYEGSNWYYLKDLKQVYPFLESVDIRKNRPLERRYFDEGFDKFYSILELAKLYSLLKMSGLTQEELFEATGWNDEILKEYSDKLTVIQRNHIKNSKYLSKYYNGDGTVKQQCRDVI